MPSPADPTGPLASDPESAAESFPVRSAIEWALHAAAVVLLGFLIWQALHLLRERPAGRAEGAGIRAALASWSTRESPLRAHLVFDSVPSPDLRDWVAALPGAGTAATWEGPALTPSAVAAEPVVDPKHPTRVWVAAPAGSGVVIRDTAGVIDSATARGGGALFTVPNLRGAARAVVGGTTASAVPRDSLAVRPVLLLGVASWEGKFILASLEEHGWKADAQFALSPMAQGVVRQGPVALQIDTAHYAAVIALDTAAARYAPAIASYVRSGGGFIATGEGTRVPAFAALLPGAAGAATQDADFTADSAQPRKALALMPIVQLKRGAVPLEVRDGKTAVAAQRVGQGRVLQVGYLETWRWRMGGVDEPVPLYRSWWSTMVSSVAYAPKGARSVSAASVDPTPLVTLVTTLGAPRHRPAERASVLDDPRLLPALFAILVAVLFVEWASRRLRGRP